MKENSDLYTVTKSDNSELENICWLIVKDGEIQKIVDASEINEFKLRKDVPEDMTKFTKSFLWRFILDIILSGTFVRFCQNIILTITSRFISEVT